jgi:hypothetical protein
MQYHNHESINNKFWDCAHYTQNDNYALLIGAYRRCRLNIKVKERPFVEGSRDFKFYKASKNYGTY